jgi:hypothetical protein
MRPEARSKTCREDDSFHEQRFSRNRKGGVGGARGVTGITDPT